MQTYVERSQTGLIRSHLQTFPAVALLGARQTGKSTLAKRIIAGYTDSVYLDLEDPRDLARLDEPLRFLEANHDALICIDEVQRVPGLFPQVRSYIDRERRNGQLLMLGSASPDLIRQSSESLAGRISYIEISPFTAAEVEDSNRLLVQGGYPESYLLPDEASFDWRLNYIRTFLERDIPQLGITVPAERLRRFWTMLAHTNGTILNQSALASSLGVSVPTIRNYIDILTGALVIRRLQPFSTNTGKRLVRSPKIYFRDTGIVHALLGIETYNELLGHPCLGTSFETLAVNTLIEHYRRYSPSFYRSAGGAEIDLVLEKGRERIAIEIKASQAPQLTRGFHDALKVVQPTGAFVIAQVETPYVIRNGIEVHNLRSFLERP